MKPFRSLFDSIFHFGLLVAVVMVMLLISKTARAESPFMELKKGLSFSWGDVTGPASIFGGIGRLGDVSAVVSGPCSDTTININLNGKRAGGLGSLCVLAGGTTDSIRDPSLSKIVGVKGDFSILSLGIGRDVDKRKWVPFFGASVQF